MLAKPKLEEARKSNRYFKAIRSQASQQTCYPVFAAFKLFRQLNSAFNYAELVYRKRSREAVSVDVNRVLGGDRGLNNGLADSNSDCNGASNRISKVSTTLGLNFSGVSRESLTPHRLKLWLAKQILCNPVSTRGQVFSENPRIV